MKTRIIHTKIWEDDYFTNLSLHERLAFIYLISNERVNISGAYELPNRIACFDTGIENEKWEKIKSKFTKDNKFIFFGAWVYVVNAEKYNNYRFSERNEKAYNRELQLMPWGVRANFKLKFTLDEFIQRDLYPSKHKRGNHGYRHREIAEKILGRKLKSSEVVHHLDRDPSNNSLNNLSVMNAKKHALYHQGKLALEDTSMILLSEVPILVINKKPEIRNNKSEIKNKKRVDKIKQRIKEKIKTL